MTALAKPETAEVLEPGSRDIATHTFSAEENIVMALLNRPDLPMERAEALLSRLDMIRERNESAVYNDAMRQVKAALPVVGRTAPNDHTKKNFADLADIAEACDKVIAEHGFSTEFWPFNSDKPDHQGIGCTVSHSCGHKRTYRADVPLDSAGAKGNANKPPIHAWKSTMTYGRRALKEAIFDIATRDDDGKDAIPSPPSIADEQLKALQALVKSTGTDVAKFCEYLKVDALPDLRADRFEYAMSALRQKQSQQVHA